MLRLIHAQTVQGALLVDDIDDGLPNKNVHRIGSTADPKAYERDGYANSRKQPCYVPRVKPADSTIAGFIDLDETRRVTHSAAKGKIYGLQQAGLISIVSFVAADFIDPYLDTYTRDSPAAGDLTLDGYSFLSILPDITSVHLAGAGVGDVTLTSAQILAVPPGAVSDTEIIIDSTLIPGLQGGDTFQVFADGFTGNLVYLPPDITGTTLGAPGAGDLTIDGNGFLSDGSNVTSIHLYGAGVGDIYLLGSDVAAAVGGVLTDTQVVVPAAMAPSLASGDSVTVYADGVTSAASVI